MAELSRKILKITQVYIAWTGYSVGTLILSFWLAWHLSAQFNFLYPVWYSMLDIEQTVNQTMPKHLYKKEFIVTNQAEHHRLFAEIVTSVQDRGNGLEEIVFFAPTGEALDVLLTESEVTHLRDVAYLIDLLGWFALMIFILCLIIFAAIIFFRIRMPATKTLTSILVFTLGILVIGILLYGAKKFFYWLHTVVFPSEHQWFFYYEESLMSTLMQAPNLFAPICLMLLIIGIAIWVIHLMLLRRMMGAK